MRLVQEGVIQVTMETMLVMEPSYRPTHWDAGHYEHGTGMM